MLIVSYSRDGVSQMPTLCGARPCAGGLQGPFVPKNMPFEEFARLPVDARGQGRTDQEPGAGTRPRGG